MATLITIIKVVYVSFWVLLLFVLAAGGIGLTFWLKEEKDE